MPIERLPSELEFAKVTYGQSYQKSSDDVIGDDYDADLADEDFEYCEDCIDGTNIKYSEHCDTCVCEHEVTCSTCDGKGIK